MTETVTPGWKHISTGFEGDEVSLGGLNPWNFKWEALGERIMVAHSSYPQERHSMDVYQIQSAGRRVKFAAGEFSNGVWGFFAPA